MARAYQPKRHALTPQSTVGMAQLLAAREDVCNVVKTSSGSSREKTVCAVNKVQKNVSPLPMNALSRMFSSDTTISLCLLSLLSTDPDGESPGQRRTSLRDTSPTS